MLDWTGSFRALWSRRPAARRARAARRKTATSLWVTPLEERRLLAGDAFSQPEFIDFVLADVVGRHVFYNHSAFDLNDVAANEADDAAIAPDKQAMLPGQAAGFANYTSYSRGLNGIMVDVAGLPGTPTINDFIFEVASGPTADVWTAAPAPQSITVRRYAGEADSDRITITWADGAITGKWLRTTVQATGQIGIKAPDVFYFGNAIGETGNSSSDAAVDTIDSQAAAAHPRGAGDPAPLTDVYDVNRDRLVDAADVAIIFANFTTAQTALPLVTGPTLPAGADFFRKPTDVFQWGDADYPVYFGPTILRTKSGSILEFSEGRSTAQDSSSYALVIRRSTDGGVTFSEPYTINTEPFINTGSPILDEVTGDIFFLYTQNVNRVEIIRSSNDGITWSAPSDITSGVKVTGPKSPVGHTFPATPWGWYAIGPGHGIQLQRGPWAGRLLVAADHRYSVDSGGVSWSHVIYSDDHGATWKLGGGFSDLRSANNNTNEATLVELENGDIYMSTRIVRINFKTRGLSRSSDGGMTWSETQLEPSLTTPSVQGTLLRLNDDVILFISSDSDTNTRRKLTIWASYDETQTWVEKRTLFYAFAGYSDATLVGPDTVLVTSNRGHIAGPTNAFQKVGLFRFNLRWLEDDTPDEFDWYFNEQPAGTAANTAGPSIADYSPWDNRAWARSGDVPPQYVAGGNGDVALALTEGTDNVLLAPAASEALQFQANESFTAQLVMRTTDADGVVLGTSLAARGWTLQLVGGKPVFSLNDLTAAPSVSGDARIDDGLWHHVAVVRDTVTKQLRLYVDRALAAAPVTDSTTGSLRSDEAVTLGQYNDGSGQLAMVVDTLRVTRGAVAVAEFLPPNYQNALPLPGPSYSNINPTTIPGLQLWMPAFDASAYFADGGLADPVRLAPTEGDGIRSAVDRSGKRWRASTPNYLQYEYDSILGPHVRMGAASADLASNWRINQSNGTSPNNFDFIQNTGEFTISMFVKMDDPFTLAGYSLLMDNSEASNALPGVTLALTVDGQLQLGISSGGASRIMTNSGNVRLQSHRWYQIAVVGNGPGSPVTFYVTPYLGTAATVSGFASEVALGGANGNYPTDANHDLSFGGRARFNDRAFNGSIAQQAIYNRPLTAAEIQQLFDFGTEYEAPQPLEPLVSPATSWEDGVTTGGLVIRRNPANGPEVTHFRIDQITGGTLYLSNGTTAVNNGDFITFTQGNAGLRFRPTAYWVATGSFKVWASKSASAEGVAGDPATGTISITPVNDRPRFIVGDNQVIEEGQGAQMVPGWATSIAAGPADESQQVLTFNVSTDNGALFVAAPQVSPNGTLTYTPAAGARGIATITLTLKDNGGTAGGGLDQSLPETFTIAVGPVLRIDGDFPSAGADEIRLVRNGDNVEVYVNNPGSVPNQVRPLADLNFISVRGFAGNDRLLVDYSGGNPLPLAGVGFDGGTGDDVLEVVGGGAIDVRPNRTTPGKVDALLDGRYLQGVAIDSLNVSGQATLSIKSLGAADTLQIDPAGAGRNRIAGTSDGTALTPIEFGGIGRLTLDLATNDFGSDDQVAIAAPGLVGATTLEVMTGGGENSLSILGGQVRLETVLGNQLNVDLTAARLILAQSQSMQSLALAGASTVEIQSGVTFSPGQLSVDAGIAQLDVAAGGSLQLDDASLFSILAGGTLRKTGPGALSVDGAQNHGDGSILEIAGGLLTMSSNAGPGSAQLTIIDTALVEFTVTQNLAGLQVGAGGLARLMPSYVLEDRPLILTHQLSIAPTGRIDLADNALVIEPTHANRPAQLAAAREYVRTGMNNFQQNGYGLSSSIALGDPSHLTTLGIMANNDDMGNPLYLGWGTFSLTADAIIVRYTFFGDASFDGYVDGTDYALTDNGYNSRKTGWENGDFDMNGVIDGTDYALVDNAFNYSGTRPTVDVLPVAPDPRQTPIDSLTIRFSQPVIGFDLSDLTLSRDLGFNLLSTAQTLTTSDHITWTLSNLTGITTASGEYGLTVLADDAEITDLWGNELAGMMVRTFVVDTLPPVADIADVAPDPRSTSIQKALIVMDGAVTGLDVGDFRLTRDGGPNLLTAAQTISQVSQRIWSLNNLADLTRTPGQYTLSLLAAGSGIVDLAGNALLAGATDSWVLQPGALLVTSAADSGAGSLRAALEAANADSGTDDLIAFDISGPGPHAIQLHSPLPALSGPVTLFVDTDVEILVGLGSPFTFSSYKQITKRGGGGLTIGGTPSLAGPAILWAAEGDTRLAGDGGPKLTIIDAARVEFLASQHIAQLTILDGALASLAAGGNIVLVTSALPIASTGALDLVDNRLVVQAPAGAFDLLYDQLRMAVVRGSHDLIWDGPGIRSSLAADDLQTASGVGIIANRNAPYRQMYEQYAGVAVDANSILVAYTLYGDADLSRAIDGADYSLIDYGFAAGLSGWKNGDFSYDGVVDGTDWTLFGNALNASGGTAVPTGVPQSTGAPPAASPVARGLNSPAPSAPPAPIASPAAVRLAPSRPLNSSERVADEALAELFAGPRRKTIFDEPLG